MNLDSVFITGGIYKTKNDDIQIIYKMLEKNNVSS